MDERIDMSAEHSFSVASRWLPAEKEGHLENADGSFGTSFAAAPSLGGRTGLVNPEELLLSALSACFLQTWAIFLGKLKLSIESPSMDASCRVEADPAGGYRVTRIDLAPCVPARLLLERRAEVEKSLALAEKYCIVSRAVTRDGLKLSVTPRET